MKIKLEKVGLPGRKYRRPRATKVAAYDEVINKMGVGESFLINTYPDSINVRNCIMSCVIQVRRICSVQVHT